MPHPRNRPAARGRDRATAPALPLRCVLGLLALLGTGAQLAAEPDATALSLTCNGCHGPDGISVGASIPSIAGQDKEYLYNTLARYRQGERRATIMDRIAKGYKLYQLRKIAGYFAARSWGDAGVGAEASVRAAGAELHREHCEECHEKDGRYRDKDVPRVAGQNAGYLYLELVAYARGDPLMPQPSKMRERVELLSEDELRALSLFYGGVE
jgi:sulfide dehydrogenase cytochrome subunit